MQKIKIRLPATLTNIGPGLFNIGLAVRMYATVEMMRRSDNQLNLTLRGEGEDAFKSPLLHPVMRSVSRFFQQLESAVLGLEITVHNEIPLRAGLGAEAALTLAGVLAANNLMGDPYDRLEVLELASRLTRPEAVVAAMVGGLGAGSIQDGELFYRSLPVQSQKLVVVVPDKEGYKPPSLPESVPFNVMMANNARLPLLLEALRTGQIDLLEHMMTDSILTPLLTARIPEFERVAAVGTREGARLVTPVGMGPAVIAFAEGRHEQIAEEMRLAYKSAGIDAQAWALPIDTQGVVVSVMQST